jgi:hypothetical protein
MKDMPPGSYTIRYRKRTEKEDRERAFTLPGVNTIDLD